MNSEYDFTRVGKQMPYNVPKGFFDDMEEKVWQQVKDDVDGLGNPSFSRLGKSPFPQTTKRPVSQTTKWVLAIAASIALLIIFNFQSSIFNSSSAPSMGDIEQAFAQLTTEDQDYLLTIYQDDVFMDEEMEQ